MIATDETAQPRFAVLAPRAASAAFEDTAAPPGRESEIRPFGDDGFTFTDFLDIINPLQHLPVVSTVYRQWTGDTIDPGARIAGGTLFGGPIGAAFSVANVMAESGTGKDLGEHVLAWFDDDEAALTGVAEADPAAAPAAEQAAALSARQPDTAVQPPPAAPDVRAAPRPVVTARPLPPQYRDDDEAAFAGKGQAQLEHLGQWSDGSGGDHVPGLAVAPLLGHVLGSFADGLDARVRGPVPAHLARGEDSGNGRSGNTT